MVALHTWRAQEEYAKEETQAAAEEAANEEIEEVEEQTAAEEAAKEVKVTRRVGLTRQQQKQHEDAGSLRGAGRPTGLQRGGGGGGA